MRPASRATTDAVMGIADFAIVENYGIARFLSDCCRISYGLLVERY
jgi:hypothetical protein